MMAMWLSPKVSGFNPPERWGHSACYAEGLVYVYGGCRGGLHFSDVLVLNLETMVWSTLSTSGQGPGPRDSHSAVIVKRKMIVFGGTNGTIKVNDVHALDLESRQWTQLQCQGTPPSPRESHTATLVGNERLVIFGGSGEGNRCYLNDLHILDLKTLRWTSPEVRGCFPVPRDSHIAVAIGNKLIVYGGDCGDQYEGTVDVLDMDSKTWSKLAIRGSAPGARAGHAAVNVGTKIYVIGGVGDKLYFNDVWILDVSNCSWSEIDIGGHRPQGRFSHTAVVAVSDIAVYGGCGEDEHPLSELLVLQLGQKQSIGSYNICNNFRSNWNHEKWKFLKRVDGDMVVDKRNSLTANSLEVLRNGQYPEIESGKRQPFQFYQEKRRKINSSSKVFEIESEQEEHSLSISQHSSPSPSDQDQIQIPLQRANSAHANSPRSNHFNYLSQIAYSSKTNSASNNQKLSKNEFLRTGQDVHSLEQKQPKHEESLHVNGVRQGVPFPCMDQNSSAAGPIRNMIGSEVRGKVDGTFDSGLLLTATVNGRIFRGVLFAPGPGVVSTGVTTGFATHPNFAMENLRPSHSHQVTKRSMPESYQASNVSRPLSMIRARPSIKEHNIRSDLEGVVLTLAGPGSDTHAGS